MNKGILIFLAVVAIFLFGLTAVLPSAPTENQTENLAGLDGQVLTKISYAQESFRLNPKAKAVYLVCSNFFKEEPSGNLHGQVYFVTVEAYHDGEVRTRKDPIGLPRTSCIPREER